MSATTNQNSTSNKLILFWNKYILTSQSTIISFLIQSLFLVLLFLTFEKSIETSISKYWAVGILKEIQSPGWIIILILILLTSYSYFLIRTKNFSIRPYEILLLFFYSKYRFFDRVWEFTPLFSYVKLASFDLLPVFIIIPKIISFRAFLNDLEPGGIKIGTIDPDLPLSDLNPRDELRRNKFAEELVDVLKNTKPSERALVIGINGSWGSGKTSLQYLINASLKKEANKEIFYLVKFNPWHYAQSNSLSHAYLNVIKSTIKSEEYLISKSIDRYASNLISNTENLIFNSGFFKNFKTERPLEEELEIVKSKISDLKKTLLVIIDDLDRLSGDELLEVFRLVRLVGDFPNTIYIILYDKEYVRLAIKENNGHNSHIYIDKIIQVEYSIPESNPDNLRQLFITNLSKGIKIAIPESNGYWSVEQINEIVRFQQFSYFIKHLRDIKRLINNFLLRYKSIYLDVNFNHFLLLEILRYKHPEFVGIIFNSKEIFLAQFTREGGFTTPDLNPQIPFWTVVVENENARAILKKMADFKNQKSSISENTFFSNYFTLTVLETSISENEFNNNIKNKSFEQSVEQYSKWNQDRKEALIYRFRNFDDLKSAGDFVNYARHLSHVLNYFPLKSEIPHDKAWEELVKMFITKYLNLLSEGHINAKELYDKTKEFLYNEDNKTQDALKRVFENNTGFSVIGDFNGNPLSNGWKEALNRPTDGQTSIFRPVKSSNIGPYIIFDANFQAFRFDYDFKTPQNFLTQVNFIIKIFDQPYAFYIKLNASKNKQYQELYLTFQEGKASIKKHSDNEYIITDLPLIGNTEFKSFQFNIDDLFKKTFASQDFVLESILGIAVRGKIGFHSFHLT